MKRSGRPENTSAAEDRALIINSKRNRFKTAPQLTLELNKSRTKKFSVDTVKRRLRNNGLMDRVAIKKPKLRTENIKKRLKFAKDHKNWSLEDWSNVLWSDESKFELFKKLGAQILLHGSVHMSR